MLRPTSSRPCPVSAVFLAITVLLFAAVSPASAESADETNLRNIAGASVTYTAQVRELLARGTDPNVPDSSGRTAVHAAAGVGAAATLEVLLEAGGDLHVQDRDGNTPLQLAADASSPILWEDDSVAAIRMLLRYGADPDVANQRGESPLHLAARSHDGSAGVMLLLGAGADPTRTNTKGNTPLHAALGPNRGVTSVVGALLHRGADPAVINGAGLTPLMTFLRYGPDNGATVTLLLFAGADPDARNPEGETPLHSAIRSGGSLGKVEVVEALLAGNADPCVPDAEGFIPYQFAEEGGAIHQALDRAGGHDFACGVEEDQDPPVVAEADRMMRAVKRSNLRSGPGTEHDVVGSLEIGDEVRVTGETGEWLRIEAPGSGTAFVYGPLLEGIAAASVANAASAPGRLCPTDTDDGECWWEIAEVPGCFLWVYRSYTYNAPISWSGTCRDGKATGEGTLVIGPYGSSSNQDNVFEQTVAISQGKRHGEAIWRFSGGSTAESRYADGRLHGRSITYEADGSCGFYLEWSQGEFVSKDDECGGTSGTTDSNLSAQTQTEVCDDWNTQVFFWSADVEDVRACLRAGADIAANDEYGTTPLHLAAGTTKFPEVVQVLLDAGADPNAKDDSDRKTPLFSAVWFNHNSEVITSLLEAGADVHARDEDGRTPLHWAATHSTVGNVEILLDSGADPRARDRYGNEPLHDVAWSDDPGVIKALVEAGADPEVRNENDGTPLHVAAAYSDIPAIVTALLEAGADLEARDERGWTPLHWAAAYNDVQSVVETLLHAGAGLETKSDEWGLTPLHFAAWKSETPDVIATLLDAGANPTARTNSGGTPWDFAQNNEALQETEVLDRLDPDAAVPGGVNDTVVAGETAYEETVTSSAAVSSDEAHASGDADDVGSTPIPVDATHCVKVHETGGNYEEEWYADETVAYRIEWFGRTYENTCDKPIVLRVRYFSKRNAEHDEGYAFDRIFPGRYRPTFTFDSGANILIDNFGIEPTGTYAPLAEIAYCAEYVDTEMTPEYLYSDRYTLEVGGEFGSYSGVVDHLRYQGHQVGPEMKAYFDAYIAGLVHSPCYAEVVREPPTNYEHFPPLEYYEISRISLFVTYHEKGAGFEALSFDEEADFGGVSFHDVGGTDTHYISDLPRPVGRN